jgi:hypothetical protein
MELAGRVLSFFSFDSFWIPPEDRTHLRKTTSDRGD